MHPDIEEPIREYAREFVLGEIGERGEYFRAVEARVISFDDVYFLGIVDGAERVSLGAVSEDDKSDSLIDLINNRAVGLISRLYDCSPDAVEERIEAIRTKVDG